MLYSHKKYNEIHGFFVMEQQVPHNSCKNIYNVIEIDNNPLTDFPSYTINVQELLHSLRKDGDYQIIEINVFAKSFTPITKADAIRVTHQKGSISWHVKNPILERIFQFEPKKYRGFVNRMKQDAEKIAEKYYTFYNDHNVRFSPLTFKNWDFLQKIIDFEQKTT